MIFVTVRPRPHCCPDCSIYKVFLESPLFYVSVRAVVYAVYMTYCLWVIQFKLEERERAAFAGWHLDGPWYCTV